MRDTRRTRLTLALLLLVAVTLITVDYRSDGTSPVSGLRDLGSVVFGPIEQAAATVVRPVRRTMAALAGMDESQQRIEELRRQNRELREQLRTAHLEERRAEEIEDLLAMAGAGRYRVVGAQLVALRGTQGFENTATIDVGRRDGIEEDMTVINGDGLVGRVASVGPTTATVLLATDATSAVGGRLEDSGEIGVVRGHGQTTSEGTTLTFELLDPAAPMSAGQRIVTFGSQEGEPYVPGVPVGTVRTISTAPGALTKEAVVDPFVDFSALDVVGVVVKPPRDDPRDSLLPPEPEPTEDTSGEDGSTDGDPGAGQQNEESSESAMSGR